MTCSACGATARPGAKFCHECGARLEWVCPACGAAVAPDQKFCAECGAGLPGAGPSEPAARFTSPRGYTPAHLAERILKERSALEGERKQVTVLFADVSGFTSLAETLDPEAVHGLMSRAFELMLAEIHRYEGTVNQFLGDGLMALFGAPVAHEDHARRAALAALGMQAALAAYRDELSRARSIDFRVRMGLNTGLVVVGAIGDNLRMDYTAVGDTTNVAARMQQIAQPGQIVVADATRRLIEPWFELGALGTVAVKNRAEPVTAWSLLRPRRGEVARHLSPLVGRADALAVLERAAESARAGRGRAVYVVGEPGIGKSRLLLELRRRLGDSMTWIEGRCLSFAQSTPFLPMTDALRQLFGIADTDSESHAIEKVTGELGRLGERAAGIGPYVRFALALDPGDAAVAAMDPAERLERLLKATSQVYRLKSQIKPLVMVIEDLHWIDTGSENYLRTVVDDLGGLAGLVILTWRPSYRPPFNEHTYVSRVLLEPLVEDDALALVRSTLGIEDLPDDLAHVIARKAEGNPFFLEEIGRALVDTGAVRAEGGRLTLTRPAATIVVPDRVQDVIAARIDRLSEDQKRTVQTASVIGREFALRLLRRVVDAPDRAERALAELKALEFVYERAALEDLEFVFKHALTQDVAYESILHARRKDLHARIGAAMEELYADRLDERVEELAYHFTRGESWGKAARYARQAGDRAAALCLDDKAEEFYSRALEALARVPETAETARLGIDLRLAMRAPLWRRGQLDRLADLLREVEGLAERCGQTERLDTVYAFFTQYHWAKGEQREALRYGQQCLEVAARRDDLALRVTGHYYVGWSHFVLGNFQQCLEHERAVLDLLDGPKATERFGLSGLPYCGACAHMAWCLVEIGDLDGAFEYLERGDRVARAAGHLYSTVPLAAVRGRVLLQQGRLSEALPTIEHVVGICREKKFVGQLMLALTLLARAYSRAGRHEEAIAIAHEAVRVKDEANAPVTRGYHLAGVAEACLAAGRLAEAEAAAREAVDWSRRLEERAFEAHSIAILGDIVTLRGDRAAGARHLEEALALASALGMTPLAERCRQSLAALG
jgi:class 3 adenylate cyclase/tetratricopeptide (TPR) repeat protein